MGVRLNKYLAVTEYGSFAAPLRNIRIALNEYELSVDLILSARGTSFVGKNSGDIVETTILDGTTEIVESSRFLRLFFDHVEAVTVHEEFLNHLSFEDADALEDAPKIGGSKAIWPLLLVQNSPWVERFKNEKDEINLDLRHYRIFSMTTYIDILGYEPEAEWLEQSVKPSIVPNNSST